MDTIAIVFSFLTRTPHKNTRQQGAFYEKEAVAYLKKHGLKHLSDNFHARRGEIDAIMRDGNTLVFVEVRYRRSTKHGHATQTVGRQKQQRIIHAAQTYLCQHYQNQWPDCRFDLMGLSRDLQGKLTYDWIQNAFEL